MSKCDVTTNGYNYPYYDNYYSSLATFYSIANGAIDNMQITVSNVKQENIYCYMNMSNNINNGDIISDTTNQVGLYILHGIGCVIFIVMLAIAIFFTCCLRYCQHCCTRKISLDRTSKSNQLISLCFQLFVYIICFAFILTGTIIYGLSVANYTKAINYQMQYEMDDMKATTWKIADQGYDNLQCSYNNLEASTANVDNSSVIETTRIVDIWFTESGIRDLNSVNEIILANISADAIIAGQNALDKLTDLKTKPSMQDSQAQEEVNNMIQLITASNQNIQNLINYLPTVMMETDRVVDNSALTRDVLQSTITNANTQLIQRIIQAQGIVKNVTQSVSDAGLHSARWSAQLWMTLKTKMNTAYKWGGFDSIISTAIAAIALPSAFMLLFILIGVIIIILRLLVIIFTSDKGKRQGRLGAHVLRGGTYFVMWTAFAPIMVSVALLWYAQIYAGVCHAIYDYDGRANFYRNIHYEDIKVIDWNNKVNKLDYSQFLSQLWSSQTVWSAVSMVKPLISSSQYTDLINVQQTQSTVNTVISQTPLNGNFSVDIADQYNQLNVALNSSTEILDNSGSNMIYLPYCTNLNKNDTFAANLAVGIYITANVDLVNLQAGQLNGQLVIASANSQKQTAADMIAESNSYYKTQLSNSIGNGIANFLNSVNNHVYNSLPVYYNYANSGDMLCKVIRGPLDATWAAAGMIALFWVPASICLFFTSSYLYKVYKTKPVRNDQQSVAVIPVVKEVSAVMVTQSVITETPIITPAVMVAGSTSIVTASTTSPAIYPTIGDDSLTIIEAL